MKNVISIYEAKTNLSKLVKKAAAGETIYIGAYGQPQAMITPLVSQNKLKIGAWKDKKIPKAYEIDNLVDPDEDIIAMFEESANQPLI